LSFGLRDIIFKLDSFESDRRMLTRARLEEAPSMVESQQHLTDPLNKICQADSTLGFPPETSLKKAGRNLPAS